MIEARGHAIKCPGPGCIGGFIEGNGLCPECDGDGVIWLPDRQAGLTSLQKGIAGVLVVIALCAILVHFFHH